MPRPFYAELTVFDVPTASRLCSDVIDLPERSPLGAQVLVRAAAMKRLVGSAARGRYAG
jgi:hypothetical protein